jgi:uncharacterized protein (TIGR03083 family)
METTGARHSSRSPLGRSASVWPVTELDYLAHIRADGEALAAAVDTGPLDAGIAACPEWDLAELARHVGQIHRWATVAAATAAQPQRGSFARQPPEGTPLPQWLRDGVDALVQTLAGIDPSAPTWHVFPVPLVAGVWPRRQAHETAIHRWDAQTAIGLDARLDPHLASDGIDEYFGVILPRLAMGEDVALPSGTLHVHCTDVPGEWLVRATAGKLDVERIHSKGDVALRGPAEQLLLHLWGRAPTGAGIDQIGDAELADHWLALGGV